MPETYRYSFVKSIHSLTTSEHGSEIFWTTSSTDCESLPVQLKIETTKRNLIDHYPIWVCQFRLVSPIQRRHARASGYLLTWRHPRTVARAAVKKIPDCVGMTL